MKAKKNKNGVAKTTNREPPAKAHAPKPAKRRTSKRPPDPSPPAVAPSAPEILEQIRDLEHEIDAKLERASSHPSMEDAPTVVREPPLSSAVLGDAEGVFETARELLSTDYYLRQWGRIGMRNRSEDVDDFGFDPVYESKLRPLFDFLYKRYFRVTVEGSELIPETGRCLLVANHSGTMPLDGIMIRTAVLRSHRAKREVRWLAEDFIFHFPFLGSISNRLGAVRACQENAERLLRQEALVAVFPEGIKGIGKLYKERYKLQRFGRGGFIKLGLRTKTPIVPVAIVGGEETNPLLFRWESIGKLLGLPYLPITPTFPLLGPLGLTPLPSKWRIQFGEPISLHEYEPGAADDEVLVSRLAERVRSTIQEMVDSAIRDRQSVWFG